MFEIGERLSEFSYGYGVTREVEKLLASVGLEATPFLPSLIHEKELGFDVSFNQPGRALFLQFKLGQVLNRFVRRDKRHSAPKLDRPFHRFNVDTAEIDGQFETLLKSELDGAEVYYVAPKFNEWSSYVEHFSNGQVMENSLLVKPSWIRQSLDDKGEPDGIHRIAYDTSSSYVCSAPSKLRHHSGEQLASSIRNEILNQDVPLGEAVRRIHAGFNDRSEIRRRRFFNASSITDNGDGTSSVNLTDDDVMLLTNGTFIVEDLGDFFQLTLGRSDFRRQSRTPDERERELIALRERARSEDDAYAAAIGMEAFGIGIQTLFVTSVD